MSHCLTVSLSYCPTVLLSYLIVLLSHCHTVLLSHYHAIWLLYCLTVLLSYCPHCLTVPLSYSPTVLQSHCPTVLLSYCHTVLLSSVLQSHCLIVPPGSPSLYGVPLTNTLHQLDTYLFIPIHSIHNYTLHHFGTPYMCHQPALWKLEEFKLYINSINVTRTYCASALYHLGSLLRVPPACAIQSSLGDERYVLETSVLFQGITRNAENQISH